MEDKQSKQTAASVDRTQYLQKSHLDAGLEVNFSLALSQVS
jgi:hypothetical protein